MRRAGRTRAYKAPRSNPAVRRNLALSRMRALVSARLNRASPSRAEPKSGGGFEIPQYKHVVKRVPDFTDPDARRYYIVDKKEASDVAPDFGSGRVTMLVLLPISITRADASYDFPNMDIGSTLSLLSLDKVSEYKPQVVYFDVRVGRAVGVVVTETIGHTHDDAESVVDVEVDGDAGYE